MMSALHARCNVISVRKEAAVPRSPPGIKPSNGFGRLVVARTAAVDFATEERENRRVAAFQQLDEGPGAVRESEAGFASQVVSGQSVVETRLPWWQKHECSGFKDVHNVQELMDAISAGQADDKYVAIEFYAGWCSSCKGSFAHVCKLAKDERLAANVHFFKANVEDESLFWWIKRNGITGLPHMAVFNSQGRQLVGLTSNLKKMPKVKAALHTILDNPVCQRFTKDQDGTIVPATD